MPRRVIKIGKKTHAKGETYEIEKDRYILSISLKSLKTLEDYDIGRGGEFYLKINREGRYRTRRVPDYGQIELMENQVYESRGDFSLWTEFIKLEPGDKKNITVRFRLYERDILKLDKKVFDQKIDVKLGRPKAEYLILEDEKGQTKAKIKVSSRRTRF